MILDNFSFITDEVAQEEDDEWSAGASSHQIDAMLAVFQVRSLPCPRRKK